jgi:predicted nucleic acid-binding protein
VILVDSSVWIDYFRGSDTPQTEALDVTLDREPVLIGDLILIEVLQGFKPDWHFYRAKRLLTSLTVADLVGRDVAIKGAQNFRKLRSRGVTVRKTIDTLIATYCIGHNLALLYSDKDFDPFVSFLGLRLAI